MYRFVAFAWNPADPKQLLAADQLTLHLEADSRQWKCVLQTAGLRVFDLSQPGSAYHAYELEGDTGVLAGKVFSRGVGEDSDFTDPFFDDSETSKIAKSHGRYLIERYWGHYVLLLREPDTCTVSVLRDPTGGLPCYTAKAAGLQVFLSDIADFLPLKLGPLSVDWQHMIAFFAHSRLITHSSGFCEVSQLAAGECVKIDLRRKERGNSEFYWHPASVYEAAVIEDPGRARSQLRDTIKGCVRAWASCYQSIVHELSGGLDSSIVAANLFQNSTQLRVTCFHFFTEMSSGDERRYARAAAERYKFELVESAVTVAQRPLEHQLSKARVASPSLLGFLPESEDVKHDLLLSRNARAVFSGQGGDHLFQHGKNSLVAAEFLARYGTGFPLVRVIGETSRLSDESIWYILSAALSYGLLRRSFDPYANFRPPSILTTEARHAVDSQEYAHPWIPQSQQLPASKIKLIFDLVDCQLFQLRPYPYADQIHPLISQPIIEACLQIPSHILAFRGIGRGLVREAFREDLPAEIVDRKSKGATTSYFNRLLIRNVESIRDLLLDGRLVREGLLDRTILESELSERNLIKGGELRSILNAVRAEAWLRAWQM